MKTMDDRMARVERLLEEMADVNRAMQSRADRMQAAHEEAEARMEDARRQADARIEAARQEAEAGRREADARMQAWFDRMHAAHEEAEAAHRQADARMEATRQEAEATRQEAEAARREADARMQAWFDRMHASHQEAEAARRQADARIEAARQEAEATRQEAEAARREADARMQAWFDRMHASHQEAKARADAIDRQAVEDRRKWGELANKMGTLVEDIVAPSIPEVCREMLGIHLIESSAQRVRRTHRANPARRREFDHVVAGGDVVLVTEVKSTIRFGDVSAFVAVLEEIRDWLWEAEGRRVVGALAGFSVDPSLVQAGERRGLLMFGLGTGLLRILNSPGFHPRQF